MKVYDYYDAHGTLVHQTVRYEPKNSLQRRPDPVTPGAYIWNPGRSRRCSTPARVLAAIQRGEPIHVAEGEKDAETLIRLGLVATTVPMGAKHRREQYTTTLTGTPVVVWPDERAAPVARHASHLSSAPWLARLGRSRSSRSRRPTRAGAISPCRRTAPTWTPWCSRRRSTPDDAYAGAGGDAATDRRRVDGPAQHHQGRRSERNV